MDSSAPSCSSISSSDALDEASDDEYDTLKDCCNEDLPIRFVVASPAPADVRLPHVASSSQSSYSTSSASSVSSTSSTSSTPSLPSTSSSYLSRDGDVGAARDDTRQEHERQLIQRMIDLAETSSLTHEAVKGMLAVMQIAASSEKCLPALRDARRCRGHVGPSYDKTARRGKQLILPLLDKYRSITFANHFVFLSSPGGRHEDGVATLRSYFQQHHLLGRVVVFWFVPQHRLRDVHPALLNVVVLPVPVLGFEREPDVVSVETLLKGPLLL